MIYADHAATTKLDMAAFEAMKPFLIEEYGNASQPYSFSRSAKSAMKLARNRIAKCINAQPDEIYFTSGGTESDNWAIKSSSFICKKKQAIITSQIEHHAILHACAFVEKMGVPVAYLPVDSYGTVHPSTLSTFISSNTKLVSIMLANNEIGTIQPVKELCRIAHDNNSLFHTDAVQALGHISIDVKDLDIDMLSASAHKFNGPKGIGFLYIKNGTALSSFMDGGAQECGKRAGTENVASIVGMSVALENNCSKLRENTANLKELETVLIHRLKEEKLEFIQNGNAKHIPGNISLSFKNADGEMLLHRLDLMGICVSTGSACNSKEAETSHVLNAIQVPDEYINGTVRISLGADNTIPEVEHIVDSLKKILLY